MFNGLLEIRKKGVNDKNGSFQYMMKKITLTVLLGLFCCFYAKAQFQITLVGRDNDGDYVRLHHVVVENRTQGWTDTLFYPDTIIMLSDTNGIGIASYSQMQGLSLSQNTPNPFQGTTNLLLSLSHGAITVIDVLDMNGRRVIHKELWLMQGTHAFRVCLSAPQQYLLTVRTPSEKAVIKMVNNGVGSGNSLSYNGEILGAISRKSYRNGGYEDGDLLHIIGYRQSGNNFVSSDTVEIVTLPTEPVWLTFGICDWFSPDDSPYVVTGEASDITRTSAVCSGEIVWEGMSPVTERGICWDTLSLLNAEGPHVFSGTGAGTFSVTLSELIPETDYYYRAYAVTPCDTVYGETAFFASGAYQIPTVTTDSATNITDSSATLGGTIVDNGGLLILSQGICWGLTADHTDSCCVIPLDLDTFSHSLTGLEYSTHYYARAYATNARGTGYGEMIEFTTDTIPPVEAYVVTGEVSDITRTSAMCSGEVIWEGIAPVTERGICWDTIPEPSLEVSHDSSGTGIGTFTVTLSELIPETDYYYRAYAITSYDTVYGEIAQFSSDEYWWPTITTDSVTDITDTSAILRATVIDDGGKPIIDKGIYFNHVYYSADTASPDNFSKMLTGLSYATHYTARAYAINEVGIGVGDVIEFTTDTILPEVTMNIITDIGSSYAICRGTLVSNGGDFSTRVGLCWSLSSTPTNADNHIEWDGTLGEFSRIIGGIHDSICYVRPYAINAIGMVYGNTLSFVPDTMPTSVYVSVAHLDHDYAIMRVSIICDSTAEITEHGLWFDTIPHPEISGVDYAENGTDHTFYIRINNLERATTYYLKGYCVSNGNLIYSDEFELLTLAEDGQSCLGTPTMTDWEGHVYNTVQIGAQCWMKSNLYTTYFPDGTPIPYGSEMYNQISIYQPYYYQLTYSADLLPTYGIAYNWKALTNNSTSPDVDPQGVCPDGWHIPDDSEWQLLKSYTGRRFSCGDDSTKIAKALASTSGWNTSIVNCSPGSYLENNDITGFSAFPSGAHMDNTFNTNKVAYIWSRSNDYVPLDPTPYYSHGHYFKISYDDNTLDFSSTSYSLAAPVRCLRNDL